MSVLPPHLRHLPEPCAEDRARAAALRARVLNEIDRDGFVPFARFMEIALYTPGLGYYAAGLPKFGAGGDFVTAPEISPLFGRTLARQAAELIEPGCDELIELGAGSGRLAADVLRELERLGRLPSRYAILEVSAELADRQRSTLEQSVPHLLGRIQWLQQLPQRIRGMVLGNEVLDALPVALVACRGGEIRELGVQRDGASDALAWAERPAEGELLQTARALRLPEGYTTEIHLAARGLIRSLGAVLEQGIVLLLDYGFAAHEYYHPQRDCGTLMGHYRHHAHDDPLALPGLQDLTAHLDFSALAQAAHEAGLEVLGYATQARFLLNCGLLDLLGAIPVEDTARYAQAASGVQKLLSPAEMGELFKAIAFGRGIDRPLLGFRQGDRSATLSARSLEDRP